MSNPNPAPFGLPRIDWAMIGILITILLQGAAGLWWAAKMDSRISSLEADAVPMRAVVETVARLDERTEAMKASTERIERKLDAENKR